MTAVIFVAVFGWAVWLLWNGRANSPRRRREDARFQHLLAEARKETRGDA